MIYEMKLDPIPFAATKAGQKVLEVRLADDKRKNLKVGDEIKFNNNATGEFLQVKVTAIHLYASIEELVRAESFAMTGGIYTDPAHWIQSIGGYYSVEEQKKHGLFAIKIALLIKLPGTLTEALAELDKYPNLKSLFDAADLVARINQKYPNGPEMYEDDFTDLFTATLLSKNPFYQQSNSNAATPEGVLSNIDRALSVINLDPVDKKALAVRLMNLKTSSLWDTLTEILLAETITKNLTPKRVKIDYPLGAATKKGQKPKDADVAMLSDTGEPMFLIDAITPRIQGQHPSAIDAIADAVERKYMDKFDAYCKSTGAQNVVIALSVLKSEILYMAFLPKLLSPKTVTTFSHPKLEALPGLAMAVVCSFRSPDGSTLVLDQIARYEKAFTP